MKTQKPLTDHQMTYFQTFGFLGFPGLLADCVDRIIEEFEAIWSAHGGGHDGRAHDGERRSAIVPFPDQSEFLSSLLDDPRIHDIASSICGEDFNYTSGDGNFYVGDTPWHSDGYGGRSVLSIKIAFYLDPVTASSGALRVIPGSHRVGSRSPRRCTSACQGVSRPSGWMATSFRSTSWNPSLATSWCSTTT